MPLATRHRRTAGLAGLLLALALGASPTVAGAGDGGHDSRAGREPWVGAGGYTYPRPTNAAKVFRWGVEEWRDEFEQGSLRAAWDTNHPRRVRQREGQITLDAGPRTGTLYAAASDTRAAYGRWEARVRGKRYDDGTPYRFVWDLVPIPVRGTGCADGVDQTITVASWEQDDAEAVGRVGVDASLAFTFGREFDLRIGYFHTFAIEVARDHVSWFVDTKVVHTERRAEVLVNMAAGTVYRPRLRMVAVPGATMARSRMQADWVRYYTLDRPGAKPVTAPRMTRTALPGTCE